MSGMEAAKSSRQESFLELYIKYTSKQESPAAFHLWVGITVLASALGRKCFINRGYYRLYPNLFCILVAGSARCRKSTAINIGVRLLDGVEATKVISGKITPEQFLREMDEASSQIENNESKAKEWITSPVLVHASELSVFLTKQSYGEPLIHILTDLYDCPDFWQNKTKNKGVDSLRNVFICILAATTPDGIAKGIPESAMHEGFASRILFIYQPDTDRRNAFPVLTAEELSMHIKLKQILEDRARLQGEFRLTVPAIDWFTEWYDKHMSESPPDKRLEGMHGRKHDHLLRLALVFAADRGEETIEPNHLDAALTALDSIERTSVGAFAQMGGNEYTPHLERAKTCLRRFRRLTLSLLLKKLYPVDALTFKTIVDTLVMSGEAKRDGTTVEWIGD